MPREFSTIGVIGLGTMGAGIAEVFARNGFDVVGVEQTDEQLARGRQHIQGSTDRAVKRARLSSEDQQELFDRITFATSLDEVKDCDLVIEAVVEHLDVKRKVFADLDNIVRPDAVLATNTSSLSVTAISAATAHPSRVVGMHFFNPAPIQDFVEIVSTVVAEPAAVGDVRTLAERLGKNPVVIGDRAGFIANALLFGYLNQAVSMYETRYATREDIDAAMQLGCGYPMGPLALLDLIGLDTAYEILETIYGEDRNRLHAPAPTLKQLVTVGRLGRKAGRGFYTYQAPDSPVVVADAETPRSDPVPRRDINTVGVVGFETMASGIAELFAGGGYDVRHVAETALGDLADVEIVVEAVADDLELKRSLFRDLDEICKPGAILATTTSSLPVIECAAATLRPSDVVGMHFLDPVPDMQLVEIVSTVTTSADVAETALALCASVGKRPVSCGDRAGFIVDALLFPYLNDAVKMLAAHYASADDIDTAMREGCRLPMGPFQLLDVVGNDVSLAIQRELFREFGEPGLAPAAMLEEKVAQGHLGRKTRKGFHDYS